MFVISSGNAWDGLVLHGPFEDYQEAHEWAERNIVEWHCVQVEPVQGKES